MHVVHASGITVSVAGAGFVATGLWAKREVRMTLARERIVNESVPVTSATAARSLAESIRATTLRSAGGRTYAETEAETPAQALWLQSTTLQTALMQAYMGSRLAELTIGLGVAFLAAGAGLTALGRRAPQIRVSADGRRTRRR